VITRPFQREALPRTNITIKRGGEGRSARGEIMTEIGAYRGLNQAGQKRGMSSRASSGGEEKEQVRSAPRESPKRMSACYSTGEGKRNKEEGVLRVARKGKGGGGESRI